jgi:hypothetical protein
MLLRLVAVLPSSFEGLRDFGFEGPDCGLFFSLRGIGGVVRDALGGGDSVHAVLLCCAHLVTFRGFAGLCT